jgi:hypothetical protein
MDTKMRKLMTMGLILATTGCVSINQGLDVQRPTEMNAQQDVTKRCPLTSYPHRLLRMHSGGGSKVVTEGGRTVNTQVDFDRIWGELTLDPGQTLNEGAEGTNKPQVDWTAQLVSFYPFKVENTCQRLVPALTAMQTDCLKVTFRFSHFWFKKDCESRTEYVVYVFIYPKTNLHMDNQWTDDPDGDGISNESEITVGTDPMDPNSKP